MDDLIAQFTGPFILCCLVVAAGVETSKRATWLHLERTNTPKPKWLRHAWRLLSIFIGCSFGLVGGLTSEIIAWHEGFAVGCGAGVLSTSVIAVIQRLLDRKVPKEQ